MSRTSRTVTVTALIAGALLSAAAVPATAHEDRHHHRGVEIGQIQFDAPGPDRFSNRSVNGEYFTVVNTSRRPVQLRDYTVSDGSRTYRFDRLRLRGGEEVVVRTGFGRDQRLLRFQDSDRHIYSNFRGGLVLRDRGGASVDRCFWNWRDGGHTGC
ncbi:lamin tail domain-containing protein [Streptomyces sp. NPDC051776]|uniref:lamin tail domain-containing protein n=1 Tax=Streptomyces sp. NPDC051776 TaxID=3155414 RepID=UPI003439E6B9